MVEDAGSVASGTMLCSVAPWTHTQRTVVPAGTVNVYYEAAAVIVALILLGRYLEARSKGRTSEAIRHLVQLQPPTATVERDGASVDGDAAEGLRRDRVRRRGADVRPIDAAADAAVILRVDQPLRLELPEVIQHALPRHAGRLRQLRRGPWLVEEREQP